LIVIIETEDGTVGLAAEGLAPRRLESFSLTMYDVKQQEALFEIALMDVVNENIFPIKQFMVFEKELDFGSKLAKKVMKELGIDLSEKAWMSIKEKVQKKLKNRQRSSRTGKTNRQNNTQTMHRVRFGSA
jgi:hypothetical protein